ncbi:MerR family DNA-binding transcriptional regulator [Mycobacterium sp. SM1]|nr:MerR family DNA-binding transcriptional regulator [Mycobacterium sp. SM1]MBS4729965.1 MerR family DNA-binding transcriptional regulator [Mycobacterium sp. SM1]
MANRRPDDYVSATSAALRLGVSTRTLRRYTQEGRLPDARGAGGRRIFRIADLDAIGHHPPADGGRMVGYARVSSRRQQGRRRSRPAGGWAQGVRRGGSGGVHRRRLGAVRPSGWVG